MLCQELETQELSLALHVVGESTESTSTPLFLVGKEFRPKIPQFLVNTLLSLNECKFLFHVVS